MSNIYSFAEKRMMRESETRIEGIYSQEADMSGVFASDTLDLLSLQTLITNVNDVFNEASKPNWDGDNAAAISLAAYRNAMRFLETLPANIQVPEVRPDNDGLFDFEWYHDGKSFSIYVGPTNIFLWAAYYSINDRSSGRFTFKLKFLDEFVEKIREIYADT
jgi:hypothetical protein